MIGLGLFVGPKSPPPRRCISHKRTLRGRSCRRVPLVHPSWRSLSSLSLGLRAPPLHSRSSSSFLVCSGGDDGYGGLEINADVFVETEVSDLPAEFIFTKILPPALTLRHAVYAMREEIEKLRMDPPCFRSGVLRFHVAVPPNIKPLNWLCTQQKSLVAFPQFYCLRQQDHKSSHGTGLPDGMLGVSGIGSAICFLGCSDALKGYKLMKRGSLCIMGNSYFKRRLGKYLSVDSPLIRAYGFVGINFHKKSSLVEDKAGSFYLFIPQVFCLMGDVSFLHDTNGLAIFSQRTRRKPMTVLVINNHGGAIFSLLPIADTVKPSILNMYFYASHDVSLSKLCAAHSVKHLQVRTKKELQNALWNSQEEQSDCVIEVVSCITDNADFHSILRKFACRAADQTLNILLPYSVSGQKHSSLSACRINKMECSLYRIKLCTPPASSHVNSDLVRLYRKGFILTIFLDDGSIGHGEVAPVETRGESLLDVEQQLRFLVNVIEGTEINYFLPLLNGSFSHWFWQDLGIPASSIFPSVRCGMEMAILNALAARRGCSLLDVIAGCKSPLQDNELVEKEHVLMKRPRHVQICALLDCEGTPTQVAYVVSQLVDEGFTTIKLKVARRENPIEDAAVIQEVRQMVGYHVNIRVDANRRWTYRKAVQFGVLVKHLNLQYIEEPVAVEDDIIKFCEETGVPAALDETIDSLEGDILHRLEEFIHPVIVAVVIKPCTVGGFEKAALIAKWAQQHEKMALVSSAFESSLSLSSYIQFAHYLEQQNEKICRIKNKDLNASIAHGLGTYQWIKEDLTTKPLNICVHPHSNIMGALLEDAETFLQNFQINEEIVQRVYMGVQVRSFHLKVDADDFYCSIKLQEAESSIDNKTVIFLHGFLGTSEDWIPIMKAVSDTARCISIDLPNHGESKVPLLMDRRSKSRLNISIDLVADILLKLICNLTTGEFTLVGYSLGARIALHMALKYSEKINGAVIISGSPGLRDEAARRIRITQDEAKAQYLSAHGLQCFLDVWYAGKLWESLRNHPHFEQIKSRRLKHNDIKALAKSLSDLSIGKQVSLWDDLKHCKKPLLFIVGEKDTKFKNISQQMYSEIRSPNGEDNKQSNDLCDMVVIPDSGHPVHLENPLPVIKALRKFMWKLDQR